MGLYPVCTECGTRRIPTHESKRCVWCQEAYEHRESLKRYEEFVLKSSKPCIDCKKRTLKVNYSGVFNERCESCQEKQKNNTRFKERFIKKKTPLVRKICVNCMKEFTTHQPNQKFCYEPCQGITKLEIEETK